MSLQINLSDETLALLRKVLDWATVNASDASDRAARQRMPAKAEAIKQIALGARELVQLFEDAMQ
jgi:hypothetical protein